MDVFARIDVLSPFMAHYDTQRHLRKVFFEEFKIHSYNYMLLLFDSVNRIMMTNSKQEPKGDENKQTINPRKVNSPAI